MSVVEVAAGVIIRSDTVLVCQRRADGSHPFKWELPGGKREPGESLAACLRRELREELAIEGQVGAEVWRTRHHYQTDRAVDLFFFLLTRFDGEPSNRVFADIQWITRSTLTGLDFLEADRPLVRILAHPPHAEAKAPL